MGYKKVCFDCRRSFNQGTDFTKMREMKCPDCQQNMSHVSQRFRPPKRKEVEKWKAAKYLFDNGFNYNHVYKNIDKVRGVTVLQGFVEYPENLKDAIDFVKKYKGQLNNIRD